MVVYTAQHLVVGSVWDRPFSGKELLDLAFSHSLVDSFVFCRPSLVVVLRTVQHPMVGSIWETPVPTWRYLT
eukprot:1157822-Pelagomonas_calceolata.AAC.3